MLAWWHRVREDRWQRSTFRSSRSPLRWEVERLLEAGRRCGVLTTEGTCRKIWQRRAAVWACVQVEGVDPTKHTAVLRPGVQ